MTKSVNGAFSRLVHPYFKVGIKRPKLVRSCNLITIQKKRINYRLFVLICPRHSYKCCLFVSGLFQKRFLFYRNLSSPFVLIVLCLLRALWHFELITTPLPSAKAKTRPSFFAPTRKGRVYVYDSAVVKKMANAIYKWPKRFLFKRSPVPLASC